MKRIFTPILCLFVFYSVKAQTPDCTTNLFPANLATDVNPVPSITLKWKPVQGALSYNIYLSAKTPPMQIIGSSLSDTFNFLTPDYGNTYYWYVVPVGANGAAIGCGANTTSFKTMAPPPPPANDNCSGATDITSGVLTGSTIGATQSQPATLCGSYVGSADDDVWYQFTAKNTGSVLLNLTSTGDFDGVVEVFSGSCGSLSSITCSDATQNGGAEQITLNAVQGTNYKVRVYSFGSALGNRGSFSLSAVSTSLPVSLVNFKGQRVGNNNVLSWTTATELNNKGFEVQSSFNGSDFKPLSFVASKANNGNSSSVLNYQFTDSKATSANEYYRLMQTDKDGHSSYSNVVLIKGGGINTLTLNSIYPNPAKNNLNVILTSPENKAITLVITDITGKTVRKQNFALNGGGNNLDVDITKLPSGSYFMKAICSNGCQTAVSKFVKE